MEDGADLSGTESDVTVVLEYSDVVGEADTAWPQAEHTQPDCECPFIEAGTAEGDTIDTLLDVDSNNSEISLDFGSDSEEVGVGTGVQIQTEAAPPKEIYKSIGFYNSMDEADRALHGFNRFVYTYRTRYLSPFVLGKVYQCRSHIGCDHRLKLATHRVDENTFRYQLLQRGKHSGTNIQLPARGISPVLKPELDALLKLGMSAGRVRNMLLFKYIREPDMLAHVPDVRKMENRKAYLKKKVTGGWEINKFIALRNWSALRMCQDRATFLSVDVDNFSDMNSMIVLHDFEHTVNVNEQQVESMGVIVTTRALFKNICRAVQDQGSTLVMSTDGTYKFHFGGWTLVDCGGISVESTDVGFVHRFRPWLYMFVRTESKFAYEQLFRTLVKYAREFYDIDVSIRSASIDHADSIASALVSVWPQIEILTCWEHLLRQSRKQSKLASESTFIKEWVQPHLRLLHASRSLKQFRGLSKRILQAWREHGEEPLANWLESVYLKPRWERWSVGSASVPGFLPTQQPIESHHRVIKVIVTDFKKAPTISVLNSVLPRVLLYDATNLSSVTQGHYAEGPLPLGAVMKAKSFLLDPQNHRIVPTKATQRPARIFFNTSKSMVQPKNMAGSPVTAARTERFQRSLRGWLGGEVPVADIQFTFLSLHQVTLHDLHLSQIEDLQLQSRWRFPEIVSIRRAMSCTCKRFKHSGWVCSHIIASLHLLDKLNIERALETIPMRGPPGRPRSTRGGLHRDDTCAVDRLIEVFTKNPGRALKWPVVEEFEVVDDGVAVPDRRIGQVAACRLSPHDGVYIWTATFVDGDTAEYKVEELVHAIRRARDMSASV